MKAALFLTEHQRLSRSSRVYKQARKIRHVLDAYPTLGRYDGVVFIEGPDADAVNDAVVRVSRLPGVWTATLHSEAR